MEFIVSSRSHWAQWLWIQSLNKHEDQREREREFGVFGLRRSGMEAERGGGVLEKSWTEGKGGSLLIWLSIMGKNKHRNVSNSFPVTNGNGYCLATATHGLCLFFFFFFFLAFSAIGNLASLKCRTYSMFRRIDGPHLVSCVRPHSDRISKGEGPKKQQK